MTELIDVTRNWK